MQTATKYSALGFDRFSSKGSTLGSTGAVALLNELDRGLRSTVLGEQCEAVVWVGQLVQQHPEPSVVNTAFLKLADLFRNGHNFIRVCILRVFRACESLLPSVINTDAVVHRFASVLDSNHASARALTLRSLGSMAILIQQHTEIHQKLNVLLTSAHRLEVEAAIYATDRLAAISSSFAELILPTLTVSLCLLLLP